jgi:hypothetical protein
MSEQLGERLDRNGSHGCYLCKDSVKRAGLKRIVQRDRDGMGGRSRMLEPYMTSPLSNHGVP